MVCFRYTVVNTAYKRNNNNKNTVFGIYSLPTYYRNFFSSRLAEMVTIMTCTRGEAGLSL